LPTHTIRLIQSPIIQYTTKNRVYYPTKQCTLYATTVYNLCITYINTQSRIWANKREKGVRDINCNKQWAPYNPLDHCAHCLPLSAIHARRGKWCILLYSILQHPTPAPNVCNATMGKDGSVYPPAIVSYPCRSSIVVDRRTRIIHSTIPLLSTWVVCSACTVIYARIYYMGAGNTRPLPATLGIALDGM
jgi:hypothetical protein